MQSLNRLFRPKTIAVIGGGAWCRLVIEQCQKMGFEGTIWPVHPKAEEVAGLPAFKDADSLPEAPDAAFIGVNRFATIEVVRALSAQADVVWLRRSLATTHAALQSLHARAPDQLPDFVFRCARRRQ